jgi:hypothetical protein
MATYNYFAHQSQVAPNYYWPNELVRNVFGYPLATQVADPLGGSFFYTLVDDSNQVEGIAGGYGPGDNDYTQAIHALIGLIVDEGVPNLGHRDQILGISPFSSVFVESGAGYGVNLLASLQNYWAFHTGVRATPASYLTGVVVADGNGNQLFDPGEGLAGVTVHANALAAVTGATGGYTLPAPGGSYTVTCSGGGFLGTGTAAVTVLGWNRQVDCISGQSGAFVDFVAVPEAGAAASAVAATAALVLLRRGRVTAPG